MTAPTGKRTPPKISVIMPVLNSADFLPDALASLAAQTRPPDEVILVDGPSTDDTPRIARSYPGARYLRQSGSTMWNALNEGIAAAAGEYIAFLSDDDLWDAHKLEMEQAWLDSHPETQIVFCHARFELVPGHTLPPSFRPELLEGDHPVYMTEALLARRRVFAELGNFPEEYRLSSDIEWFGRMLRSHTDIQMLPQVLLTKRIHSDNLSSRPSSGSTLNHELLDIMRKSIRAQRQQGTNK